MPSSEFKKALSRELPILFVNIGWGTYYDGTETITGNHKYLRENPGSPIINESKAFVPSRGFYRCGIGYGKVPSTLHIVYVARDRRDKQLKAVGIYASATIAKDTEWVIAKSDLAERIPVRSRPEVNGWPPGQGVRRWALKNGKTEHQELLTFFKWFTEQLTSGTLPDASIDPAEDDEGHEGDVKRRLVKHRRRESRIRNQKITDALRRNNDRLICEVPNCGFDFHAKYGELGIGFAEVHHNKPLSEAPSTGRVVRLADLAIVCANCHRMVHLGGQCRPLANLIPREK
jgi:hypothetical protein